VTGPLQRPIHNTQPSQEPDIHSIVIFTTKKRTSCDVRYDSVHKYAYFSFNVRPS
jgi:hypothetical protein